MSHYEPRRHKIGTYMISAKPASNVDHSDDYIVLWVSKNKVLYNVIQDVKCAPWAAVGLASLWKKRPPFVGNSLFKLDAKPLYCLRPPSV